MTELEDVAQALQALRPAVDDHITQARVRRYLQALSDTPAASTTASAMRTPILRRLLAADGAFTGRLHLDADFGGTGSTVLLCGDAAAAKPLWYFAHLDTISYLTQPFDGARYPLVAFCYHLMTDGVRRARAYRYDLATNLYGVVADGVLESDAGTPFFRPLPDAAALRAGDRVVPVAVYQEDPSTGQFTGHVDNAGGVAALAVAAPVLAEAGIAAMLAFPDEEEGPPGSGNQVMGRGGTRIVNLLPVPELAIIADVQQAGGEPDADVRAGLESNTRLGGGAVLAEFSSLARGAVTPPQLYVLARYLMEALATVGVKVQESNNAYTSRSDDVGVLLKTPNILLLGFPGFNRHFDRGEPRAHLDDVVHLAKALAYASVLQPWLTARRGALFGGAP